LSGSARIDVPAERRKSAKSRSIVIEGVTTNNLQNVSATFPLGLLIGVTGVSGSGKSSLHQRARSRRLSFAGSRRGPKPGPHTALHGASQIDKVIPIDQSPLGRSLAEQRGDLYQRVRRNPQCLRATKEA
jgi:excinuclease ABC subunit A